jgi:autotransporter-associated beta strand protein
MNKDICGWIVSMLILAFVNTVQAAEYVKADNSDNLNVGNSWEGSSVPGWRDTGKWDNTVTGVNSVSLGGDMNVLGFVVTDPGGAVTIGGANSLTTNFKGFDLSLATTGLSLSMQELIIGYNCEQVWNVTNGQVLAVNPTTLTHDGATVSIQGLGTVSSTTLSNDATGIVGPWLRTGTGTSTKYGTMSGGNIVPYTGTAAASAANVTDITGAVNYELADGGTFGAGASFNTLRYTGGWDNLYGAWSANGIMNAGTSTLTFNENGSIGASRELVLTSPDTSRILSFKGAINDNAGGASDVIVTGRGSCYFNVENTYSGKTYVNSGQLYVSDDSALGSTNAETIVSVNGSSSTGGQLVLRNVTLEEPLVFTGYGDGDPWNQSMRVDYSGGTNNLNGPITLSGGAVRITAGGNNTMLNINAPITRTSSGATLILGANGGNGVVNVNALIDNASSSITTHNGPGFVNFNVSGCDAGTLNVQTDHIVSLGVSNAFVDWCSLAVGGKPTTGGNQARGTFDMNGFSQTFNSFYGNGISSELPTTRVVTNSSEVLSVLASGSDNGAGSFNGVFGGNIAYVKNGSGSQWLIGPNSYTGGTTVNGGTLVLSNAVNHGSLEVNSGTFRFSPSLTVNGNLSGNGGVIDSGDGSSVLTVNQDSYSYFNGDINNSGALVKNGSGILVLAGNNSYSGGTTVNEGILIFGSTNSIPNTGSVTANPGSNLGMGVGGIDSFDSDDVDDLWAGTHPDIQPPGGSLIAIDTSAGDFTYATSQTDTNGLIKVGPNTLYLTGNNSYSAGTIVQGGILSIPVTSALPGWNMNGAYEVCSGACIAVGNSVTDLQIASMLATTNFNDGAAIGFDTDSGNRTYAVNISNTLQGALGVYKINVDNLYLHGTNSYDGNTVVAGGRVSINNSNALGSTNGYTRVLRVGGSGNYSDATGQLQFNGSSGDLVIDENFYINGAEQFGYGGVLRNEGGNNTFNGWIRLERDSRITCAIGNMVINGVVERAADNLNPMLVSNPSGSRTIIYSNLVSLGTGSFFSHSSGTTVLAKPGNVFGDVQIQYTSTLKLGVSDAIADNSRILFGTTGGTTGALDLNGYDDTIRSIRNEGTASSDPDNVIKNSSPLKESILTINQSSTINETFKGIIQDAITIIKDGVDDSVLTLGGPNTYSGSTIVRGGTLKIDSVGTLGLNCTNVVIEGGTLELNNSSVIADNAVLSIISGDGATVELASGVNEEVEYLFVDSEMQASGTYGSTSSAAANKNDTYFSGAGVLTVRKDNRGCVIILR